MRFVREVLVGICLMSGVAFAQQPAPTKTPVKTEKKKAPAVSKQKTPQPAAAQPQQAPATASQQEAAAPAPGLESQPGGVPTSTPGDTYEQNPTELQQMACELNGLIKAAEAKASPSESADARASREALIVSRKRELKGALSVYKKVTGQALNLETSCQ